MKKVAIITLFGYFNYGNRLQNYAMQELLKKHNCEVDTIKLPLAKNKKSSQLMVKRKINFYEWSIKYIKERPVEYSNVIDILNQYDYICVGSDQIFTPKSKTIFKLNFLKDISADKKFTFAASFGRSVIPDNLIPKYRNGLNDFKIENLSIREMQGRTIIKNIINKEALIHLDPTILLGEKAFDSCLETDNLIASKQKYILTYFLAETDSKKIKEINKFSNINDYKIININDRNLEKIYTLNPGAFLNLVKNSEKIYTDSYHGVLFSIIYKKDFEYIENRRQMRSRINTLFKIFKIENNGSIIDYQHINKVLRYERIKATRYLKNILGD